MSPAVTAPGLVTRSLTMVGSSPSRVSTSSFRFKITSMVSSRIPSMAEYSWCVPVIFTWVTAAPGIDESSIRRMLLPSVWPSPLSSGSMTKTPSVSFRSSTLIWGFWIPSKCLPSVILGLSRIELDDELVAYLYIRIDARWQLHDSRRHSFSVHLQPGHLLAVEAVGRYLEHRRLARLWCNRHHHA